MMVVTCQHHSTGLHMSHSSPAAALFIANDLALDFINSAYGPGNDPVELLGDDQAVVDWLAAAGVVEPGTVRAPTGVLKLATALRSEARGLLAAAQAGRTTEITVVNRVLEKGRPIVQLQPAPGRAVPVLVERRRDDSAESLLEPIAVALGRLLSGGDLEHVRECEANDCTLLFHDTTKSRKRRWCSMAQCGNRMKVAAYRSRKSGG
jgi:predicted RNA-binding Zn ribbon-like protein